jgi:DNA repair ATPase RecN
VAPSLWRTPGFVVRTPETRVATDNPVTTPRPLIRQISWTGGFLDRVTIPLAADLTALIGGRGTGKSTVIESLRYVLDIEPFGEAARRDHQAIVSGVLRSGTTVRVEIETVTPTPRRFAIERSVPNPPLVRDSSGTATNLRPEDVIGLVEVFGQHELAELAQDKTSVARMLERFAGAEAPDQEHAQILEQLKENREKLQRADKARDDLDAELSDIPRLEEHVQHYIDTDLPTRLSELQRLTRDESVFAEGIERIGEARRILHPLTDAQVSAAISAPIDNIDDSPQASLLQRVPAAMSELNFKLAELSAAAEAALDGALREVQASSMEWKTVTDGQRTAHAEVLRKLVEDGHDPDKYLTTTAALEALKAKASRRDGITTTINNLLRERSELLGKLAAYEVSRSEALHEAIRAANAATAGVVVVRPIPSPNRRNIKSVIENHVSGVRTQIMAAVDANGFSPRAFAAAVRGGATELAKLGIRGAQTSNLMGAGEELLRELEELSVGQAVEVLLDIAAGSGTRELRSLDELSKGQRATALLLLLLGASSAPLIIDQPEDDLDNRFVYDGIVQKLRQLKGSRQVIASTHNANVPVLGDAELIVALEGDGQRGWPIADGVGSLDDAPIRAHAENLLEGGPAAFNARQHLYGF